MYSGNNMYCSFTRSMFFFCCCAAPNVLKINSKLNRGFLYATG